MKSDRWIVPDMKYPGHLKLVVGPRPLDAICEAPHNYTTDMEPYLEIHHVLAPGKMPEPKAAFHPDYLTHLQMGTLKKKGQKNVDPKPDAKPLIDLAIETKRLSQAELHNSLNPLQRFIYSIAGPAAHSPRPFFKFIFEDKLLGNGLVAGVKIDV